MNDNNNREYLIKWALQSFERTLNFSASALRASFLINGMACVALLAYLGQCYGKETNVPHGFIWTISCFCLGCISTTASCFFSYCAQIHFTWHAEKLIREDDSCEENARKGKKYNFIAIWSGCSSVLFFVLGTVFFCVTMW